MFKHHSIESLQQISDLASAVERAKKDFEKEREVVREKFDEVKGGFSSIIAGAIQVMVTDSKFLKLRQADDSGSVLYYNSDLQYRFFDDELALELKFRDNPNTSPERIVFYARQRKMTPDGTTKATEIIWTTDLSTSKNGKISSELALDAIASLIKSVKFPE